MEKTGEVRNSGNSGTYSLPIMHTRIPEPVVNAGFLGLLAGAIVTGVVEAPVAALMGVAVVIARHRRRSL